MNKRIGYGKLPPTAFFEEVFFDVNRPYSLRYKTLPEKDIALAHYATTFELFVSIKAIGSFFLDGQVIPLSDKHAIVVPAYTIHSVSLEPSDGEVFVLQLSFEALKPYVDIEKLLYSGRRRIIPMELPEMLIPFILDKFQQLIKHDDDILICINMILNILGTIIQPQFFDDIKIEYDDSRYSEDIQKVINWTMTHFRKPIALDDVANYIGYTKSYFCTWFKNNTGMSYIQYVNAMKINYSCEVLIETSSITSASESVGFENISYFIQLFKKIKGYTPKQYLRKIGK
ncbi:MAG TPA: helix-turn-helix transcriptional regulator [Christensenellaceae bacterium]|jgi:AraC-like DNA-binding protein|nr:helix-turn-helix transcriptional regulator [Christensenellaceae bacterium]